jgi:ankyrin repeat protein
MSKNRKDGKVAIRANFHSAGTMHKSVEAGKRSSKFLFNRVDNVANGAYTPTGSNQGGVLSIVKNMPIAYYGVPTLNSMIFSRGLWENMLHKDSEFMGLMSAGSMWGEPFHTDEMDVDLTQVSHTLTGMRLGPDKFVYGDIAVLDTPNGNIIHNLLKVGYVGISSRGWGSLIDIEDDPLNQMVSDADYMHTSFDFVSRPAVPEAVGTINEYLKANKSVAQSILDIYGGVKGLPSEYKPLVSSLKSSKSVAVDGNKDRVESSKRILKSSSLVYQSGVKSGKDSFAIAYKEQALGKRIFNVDISDSVMEQAAFDFGGDLAQSDKVKFELGWNRGVIDAFADKLGTGVKGFYKVGSAFTLRQRGDTTEGKDWWSYLENSKRHLKNAMGAGEISYKLREIHDFVGFKIVGDGNECDDILFDVQEKLADLQAEVSGSIGSSLKNNVNDKGKTEVANIQKDMSVEAMTAIVYYGEATNAIYLKLIAGDGQTLLYDKMDGKNPEDRFNSLVKILKNKGFEDYFDVEALRADVFGSAGDIPVDVSIEAPAVDIEAQGVVPAPTREGVEARRLRNSHRSLKSESVRESGYATSFQEDDVNEFKSVLEGRDVNELLDKNTLLEWATAYKAFNIVKYLVGEKGVDIGGALPTAVLGPVFIRSRRDEGGSLEIVKYLIENGADVNFINSSYYSPLLVAAESGQFEIVKYLVESGADINVQTAFATTAYSVARSNGYDDIADYLKGKGGYDPNSWDPNENPTLENSKLRQEFTTLVGSEIQSAVNGKGDLSPNYASSVTSKVQDNMLKLNFAKSKVDVSLEVLDGYLIERMSNSKYSVISSKVKDNNIDLFKQFKGDYLRASEYILSLKLKKIK